ncbi:helix-turn-helix domain-containing protein [Hamadaea sp.]|uniref:helix-turn-helix domain-containing protein n=1 Tax=Hamadaea sp. TaxID=2024425 RepID=UPI0025C0BC63|nr:helix-turn-helix domain-containing protein [Hamadaea sp.]
MTAAPVPDSADVPPLSGLVIVDHYDQAAGYSVSRPHGADSWLFTWTTGGSGRMRQGRTVVDTGPGDLVVLGPGVRQHYEVAPGTGQWTFWWAHCQARATWSSWLRPYSRGDRLYAVGGVPEGVRERVETGFRRMHADARWTGTAAPPEPELTTTRAAVAHSDAARELALCALEEIVLLATTAARPDRPEPRLDDRISRAQALIAADPGAPHTVRSLAAAVAISPSRFAHLYADQTGQSPMQALRDARLVFAARLLEATELPVERVAAASGFPSASHFSRAFRQRYGVPPGSYRSLRR